MDLGTWVNTLLYITGSLVFIPGCLFFHPALSGDPLLYKLGVVLLVVGSILFTLAPCQLWWGHYSRLRNFRSSPSSGHSTSPSSPLILHLPAHNTGSLNPRQGYEDGGGGDEEDASKKSRYNPTADDLAVSLVRSSVAVLSGIVFVLGSAAFWPSFGHSGAIVGNWMYRCGSTWGLCASLWGLARSCCSSSTWAVRAMMVFGCLGSIGFLVGGGFFLAGGYDAEGSITWMLGSFAFFLSSLCVFAM